MDFDIHAVKQHKKITHPFNKAKKYIMFLIIINL